MSSILYIDIYLDTKTSPKGCNVLLLSYNITTLLYPVPVVY